MTADEVKRKISLDKHFRFRFGTILIIFLSIELNLEDSKKKRLSKKQIKKQLLDLMIIDEVVKI